jgi:hypothetical protein
MELEHSVRQEQERVGFRNYAGDKRFDLMEKFEVARITFEAFKIK